MEEYLSACLVNIEALLQLWNCPGLQCALIHQFHRLGLLRNGSAHDLKKFYSSSRLLLVGILCCILISSLLSTHIETKLLLKATCLFKYEWYLNGHQALNGWHMLKMFTAHPSLGPWERRLFTLRKFIKLITLRQICIFPQFPLSPILIKQMHFCFCFRRKATLLKVTSTTKLFFVIK